MLDTKVTHRVITNNVELVSNEPSRTTLKYFLPKYGENVVMNSIEDSP